MEKKKRSMALVLSIWQLLQVKMVIIDLHYVNVVFHVSDAPKWPKRKLHPTRPRKGANYLPIITVNYWHCLQ